MKTHNQHNERHLVQVFIIFDWICNFLSISCSPKTINFRGLGLCYNKNKGRLMFLGYDYMICASIKIVWLHISSHKYRKCQLFALYALTQCGWKHYTFILMEIHNEHIVRIVLKTILRLNEISPRRNVEARILFVIGFVLLNAC